MFPGNRPTGCGFSGSGDKVGRPSSELARRHNDVGRQKCKEPWNLTSGLRISSPVWESEQPGPSASARAPRRDGGWVPG